MNDYVIITINGTDYYCPANLVKYITSDLVNTYSSSITLYRDIYNNNGNHYPRITLGSYSLPIYYSGNNTGTNLTVDSVEFSMSAQYYRAFDNLQYVSCFFLFILAVMILIRRFKE